MNGTLFLILVAIACYVIAVRLSPGAMKKHADWLNARADAEEWFKVRHSEYKTQRAEREEQ